MLKEAVDGLAVKPGKWYLDTTFGRGGHSAEILKQGGKVLVLDVDQESIEYGQRKFSDQINSLKLWSTSKNSLESLN